MNTHGVQTIKAEGPVYGAVWEALTYGRRAQFFSRELDVRVGAVIRFWRRRAGIKTVIRTRVAEVQTLGLIKKYVLNEAVEEDEE